MGIIWGLPTIQLEGSPLTRPYDGMPPRPNWMRNSWRIVLPCWSKKKRRCGRVRFVILGVLDKFDAFPSVFFKFDVFICSFLLFFCVTCFVCAAFWSSCTYPWVVVLTNADQAWKKIEECGNLVAKKMAKNADKYKVGLPLLLVINLINGLYNSHLWEQKTRETHISFRPFLRGHYLNPWYCCDASEIDGWFSLHLKGGATNFTTENPWGKIRCLNAVLRCWRWTPETDGNW